MAQKQSTKAKQDEQEVEHEVPAAKEFDIDAILDEIDNVLEENAEQFVSQYVQAGGE